MTKAQKIPRNSFKVFLSIFSGEEKEYVRLSDQRARVLLGVIGAFVILIFTGCLLSAYFFFDSLIQGNYWISIPVGILWGLLVVNMYLLLLYTVSPTILPHKKNKEGFNNGLFTFSMFLRIGFMSLLAIITAQPLNCELFSKSVEKSLGRHVQEEKAQMIIATNTFVIDKEIKDYQAFYKGVRMKLRQDEIATFEAKISSIKQKIKRDSIFNIEAPVLFSRLITIEKKLFPTKKELVKQTVYLAKLDALINDEINSDSDLLLNLKNIQTNEPEFLQFKTQLEAAMQSKIKSYEDLNQLLSHTNFYIKRVQLIFYENPWSWMVTTIICLLFIVPIILKYQVRKLTKYYHRRITIERDDVIKHYNLFKTQYSNLLLKNITTYNFSSLQRLNGELEILKKHNRSRYEYLNTEIQEEYKAEVFSKYEYWMDNPFRTTPKKKTQVATQPPISLMDFLYNQPENLE